MKVAALINVTLTLVCTLQLCRAQSLVSVSKPDLSLKDGSVQITYDILNSTDANEYTIRIEVSDAKGRSINANSLSGDIGEHVRGGNDKKIFWDIAADSIFLDEEIFVEVYALAEPPPVVEEPVVQNPEIEEPVVEDQNPGKGQPVEDQLAVTQESSETSIPKETKNTPAISAKKFNRSALILQSVALPGLGLSRVKPGRPHWIKGIVGYGCIAGAIYFNNQAVISYDAYKVPSRLEEVDGLYNKAANQDLISEVLAFSAIGVWITDLVWTFIGTADLTLIQPVSHHKGISIGPSFAQESSVPLIAFRYTF